MYHPSDPRLKICLGFIWDKNNLSSLLDVKLPWIALGIAALPARLQHCSRVITITKEQLVGPDRPGEQLEMTTASLFGVGCLRPRSRSSSGQGVYPFSDATPNNKSMNYECVHESTKQLRPTGRPSDVPSTNSVYFTVNSWITLISPFLDTENPYVRQV